MQLQDSHSNPTCVPDIPIRWRLSVADGDSAGDDALEAPELCCSAGDVQLKTDENGRAYFGEVAVVQDSGRMVRKEQVPTAGCSSVSSMLSLVVAPLELIMQLSLVYRLVGCTLLMNIRWYCSICACLLVVPRLSCHRHLSVNAVCSALLLLVVCMPCVQPSGSLLCTLELQVLVPRVKSRRSSTTTGSWSTVWQRQVLFTDNASRIRELQVSMNLLVC